MNIKIKNLCFYTNNERELSNSQLLINLRPNVFHVDCPKHERYYSMKFYGTNTPSDLIITKVLPPTDYPTIDFESIARKAYEKFLCSAVCQIPFKIQLWLLPEEDLTWSKISRRLTDAFVEYSHWVKKPHPDRLALVFDSAL